MLRFSVDIGRRPSPHATARGGLELFGGNLCHKQSEPTSGGHPYWRRRLLELCVHNRGESGLVDLSIGVRISNMTVRDSLTTTLTSGPRLSAYGTLTAAWVTAGVSSSRTDPCVAGSTSCDRGDQPPTVAEPTSLALLGTGLVLLAWFNRRNFAFGGSATAYRAN